MVPLNFHHLHYFWAVAHDGNLTRTAGRLRVSPSALSTQIRQLEDHLGQPLFARAGRSLVLTETGRIALAYADDIFAAGGELVATLKEGRRRQHTLRVGAVATLSRNFQRSFLRPLLGNAHVRLELTSASAEELLSRLEAHALDVVLANRPAARTTERRFRSRRLARQPVSIVCSVPWPDFRFPESLAERPLILPGPASDLHGEFDALCERLGARVRPFAQVDDMAMIRLLARDSQAIALVPSIVVRDELRQGILHELCVVPALSESFYAVTVDRRFQHPLLRSLLERDEADLLSVIDDVADAARPSPPPGPPVRRGAGRPVRAPRPKKQGGGVGRHSEGDARPGRKGKAVTPGAASPRGGAPRPGGGLRGRRR
jgi:LysR family transcriptional activator of nhaA